MLHDVIIVGGGYAGMAAALQVAHARRRVLVLDTGLRRNRFASHSHGFLGQDGKDPGDIATGARPASGLSDRERDRGGGCRGKRAGQRLHRHLARRPAGSRPTSRPCRWRPRHPSRRARGAGSWGESVFHCPYCHGCELGGPLSILATGRASLPQALHVSDWGPVTLLLNESFIPDKDQRLVLEARGVRIEPIALTEIRGHSDLVLADGREIALAGIFVMARVQPGSSLVRQSRLCA